MTYCAVWASGAAAATAALSVFALYNAPNDYHRKCDRYYQPNYYRRHIDRHGSQHINTSSLPRGSYGAYRQVIIFVSVLAGHQIDNTGQHHKRQHRAYAKAARKRPANLVHHK